MILSHLRLWWRALHGSRGTAQPEALRERLLLEFRRMVYGQDVPGYASAAVLAQRLGVATNELQPILNALVDQRLAFRGPSGSTYGPRERAHE